VAEAAGNDPTAESVIRKLVDVTQAKAPFLLRKVRTLVLQHAKYRETIMGLIPQLERQIELEREGKMVLQPDTRMFPASKQFRKAFDEVFAHVHRRVFINLADRSLVARALTEVFVDFLVRWGEEFTQLEPHHRTFLEELCDRTCAQLNGDAPESFVPKEESDEPLPNVRRLRLPDDIFKNVWMEVNEFYLTGKRHAELERDLHKPVIPVMVALS